MPDKRGKVVILMGSPGGGKTKIAAALLSQIDNAFNVNKDMFSSKITVKAPTFHKYLYQVSSYAGMPKIEQDSLYEATLLLASHNLRNGKPGRTVIIEGNFGKRLTEEMLQRHFVDLQAYDFYLVHVICSDSELEYQRVLDRNDPKDKNISSGAGGKTYDITDKKIFTEYCKLRFQEEITCIETMSKHMSVITVDNCSSNPHDLDRLVFDLRKRIEGRPERPHSDTSEPVILNLPAAFFEEVYPYPNTGRRRALSFSGKPSAASSQDTPPSLKSANKNISPLKHPLTFLTKPPQLDLDNNKDKTNINNGESKMERSLNMKNTRSSDKGGTLFTSLWGRERDVAQGITFDERSKSPRLLDPKDPNGRGMTRRDSLIALNLLGLEDSNVQPTTQRDSRLALNLRV